MVSMKKIQKFVEQGHINCKCGLIIELDCPKCGECGRSNPVMDAGIY